MQAGTFGHATSNKSQKSVKSSKEIRNMDNKPHSRSPLLDNPSKLTRMDWCLWSNHGYKKEDWKLQRCSPRCYVKHWWTKFVEAMSHNGRTITNIKTKANISVNYYARVRKLNMSKADRDLYCHFKKQLDTSSADNESYAPLQMGELLSAIKKMKSNGAAGPKNIHSSFLKSIGPCSLAHCPQIGTATNIIPLLKTWKSPGLVKLHLSTLSVSNPVLSNFWKKLLPIIFTTLWRRKICSADSELGFIKVQAAKIRSLVKSKQQ